VGLMLVGIVHTCYQIIEYRTMTSVCISISTGGYLPFGDACPSDHRMIWMEIQYSIAFGQRSPEIAKIQPKRLKTSDPRIIKKYNLRVKKVMRDTGFRKRYEALKEQTERGKWNDEMIEQYNARDKEDPSIRDSVEQGIRKLNMGGVQWSPKLQSYRDTIELWKMIQRKRKGVKISVKIIRRFMAKTRIRDALSNDLEQTEMLLDTAHKSYKDARKLAATWRNEFLESLAEAKAEKNGTSMEKELKSLVQIEKQRRQARSIKRMRGKLGTGQATKVYQTSEEGVKQYAKLRRQWLKRSLTKTTSDSAKRSQRHP
jgi:hypothetical protein